MKRTNMVLAFVESFMGLAYTYTDVVEKGSI